MGRAGRTSTRWSGSRATSPSSSRRKQSRRSRASTGRGAPGTSATESATRQDEIFATRCGNSRRPCGTLPSAYRAGYVIALLTSCRSTSGAAFQPCLFVRLRAHPLPAKPQAASALAQRPRRCNNLRQAGHRPCPGQPLRRPCRCAHRRYPCPAAKHPGPVWTPEPCRDCSKGPPRPQPQRRHWAARHRIQRRACRPLSFRSRDT